MPGTIEQALERLLRDRQAVASTLHDDISQALTVAILSLKRMDEAPPMRMALAALDEAADQVRDVTVALRPSLLDQAGLLPALRLYSESERGQPLTTSGKLDTSTWSDVRRGRWYWACQQILLIGDGIDRVEVTEGGAAPALVFSPWTASIDAVSWLAELGLVCRVDGEALQVSDAVETGA